MASALSMIKRNGSTAVAPLVKGGISYGTARLLVRHLHGKKEAETVPWLVAGLGKGLPALITLFAGDVDGVGGMALGAMDAVGQGAFDTLGVMHGLADVRKAKGLVPVAIPVGASRAALPAGTIQDAQLVGALGLAQPGGTMTMDQIRQLQSYR